MTFLLDSTMLCEARLGFGSELRETLTPDPELPLEGQRRQIQTARHLRECEGVLCNQSRMLADSMRRPYGGSSDDPCFCYVFTCGCGVARRSRCVKQLGQETGKWTLDLSLRL